MAVRTHRPLTSDPIPFSAHLLIVAGPSVDVESWHTKAASEIDRQTPGHGRPDTHAALFSVGLAPADCSIDSYRVWTEQRLTTARRLGTIVFWFGAYTTDRPANIGLRTLDSDSILMVLGRTLAWKADGDEFDLVVGVNEDSPHAPFVRSYTQGVGITVRDTLSDTCNAAAGR